MGKIEDISIEIHTIIDHVSPESDAYRAMAQGPGTNMLSQVCSSKTVPATDPFTGEASITTARGFRVSFENLQLSTANLRSGSAKLLDFIAIKFTAQNSHDKKIGTQRVVSFSIEEYMKVRGISITKEKKYKFKKKHRQDLSIITSLSIGWNELKNGKLASYKMPVYDLLEEEGENVRIRLSEGMAAYLRNAYIMQFPIELFQVDERNPAIYALGRKMFLHYSIDANRKNGTHDILSVKTLLEYAGLPTYDEVMATNRCVDERIVAPLTKTLDALSSILSWAYCNSKKAPLEDWQRENFTHDIFILSYVHFKPLKFPDQIPRLKAKQKRRTTSSLTTK